MRLLVEVPATLVILVQCQTQQTSSLCASNPTMVYTRSLSHFYKVNVVNMSKNYHLKCYVVSYTSSPKICKLQRMYSFGGFANLGNKVEESVSFLMLGNG